MNRYEIMADFLNICCVNGDQMSFGSPQSLSLLTCPCQRAGGFTIVRF